MKKDTIKVKDLQKIIHLNTSDIPRLKKGRQNLPHLGRKTLRPLLSYDSGLLTFDDLKLYTIYVLFTRDNRTLTIDKRIEKIFNLLEKNNQNIDGLYKEFILKNIEKIEIKKEHLYTNFNFETSIDILKKLCPLKIEPYYSSPDFFNFEEIKEKVEETENELKIREFLIEKNIKNCKSNNILDLYIINIHRRKKDFFHFNFLQKERKNFLS